MAGLCSSSWALATVINLSILLPLLALGKAADTRAQEGHGALLTQETNKCLKTGTWRPSGVFHMKPNEANLGERHWMTVRALHPTYQY